MIEKPGIMSVWSYVKRRWILAVWSIWIVLLVELFSRTHAGEPFSWSVHHVAGFLLNSVLTGCLLALFGALIGRARPAFWVVTAILLVLGLISGIKLKMLGIPLLPWDFVLAGEGTDMAQYLSNIVNKALIGGLLVFAAGSVFIVYRNSFSPLKFQWKERVILGVASIAVLAGLYFDKPLPVRSWTHIDNMSWDQGANVKENGFLLTTFMNVEEMFVSKPEDYDADAIAAIAQEHQTEQIETDEKPNIIVILSESFFDPTKISTISYSRDPLPFFHQLQKTYTTGTMLSPQYGGGTANVEYEVLTGNSLRFFPQGTVVYNQYMTRGVDSMASILRRQGYTSTAISPFYNWFFNSKDVYKNLGFGKFISLEFFNPKYSGPYIADSEVANNIIESSKRSDGPDFIFANTMENHFHYYPGKFPENTIEVTGATGESKGMLETYAQGLIGADNMLKQVVDYYQASQEPTIVFFFGDHLPYLGDNYEAYKDIKYISGEDDPDFLNKMYRVPFVVWNNFLPEKQDRFDVSPSFMSPYLLDLAKRPGTYYTDYLRELSKRIPIIPPRNYYEQMNINEADLKQYENLQYDIMFGDQIGFKAFKDQIVKADYHLGYEAVSIDRVTPAQLTEGAADAVLVVSGQYVPPQSTVYWNSKALTTTWNEKDGTLSAKVPPELLKEGTANIAVKVIDSKDTVVGQSNAIPVGIGKKQ